MSCGEQYIPFSDNIQVLFAIALNRILSPYRVATHHVNYDFRVYCRISRKNYNGPPVKTKSKENIVNQYLPTLTLSVA